MIKKLFRLSSEKRLSRKAYLLENAGKVFVWVDKEDDSLGRVVDNDLATVDLSGWGGDVLGCTDSGHGSDALE